MASKLNIQKILRLALAIGLVLYLLVSYGFTSQLDRMRVCKGMRIEVVDSLNNGFVTSGELTRELGDLYTTATGRPLHLISLNDIEKRLAAIDKIESVNAIVRSDDSIYVRVVPLVPAIRVYDNNDAYYVNRAGKRIHCDARYHIDVPIVKGHFFNDDPTRYIPLADAIEQSKMWSKLISMIEVASPTNVYLIPDIKGQVIAFGSPTDIADKLRRIEHFYSEVLPHKGWNYYDTISVKWDGHIYATKANKVKTIPNVIIEEPNENDYENLGLDELIDSTVLVKKETPSPKPLKTP